jgi:hypothetical protein
MSSIEKVTCQGLLPRRWHWFHQQSKPGTTVANQPSGSSRGNPTAQQIQQSGITMVDFNGVLATCRPKSDITNWGRWMGSPPSRSRSMGRQQLRLGDFDGPASTMNKNRPSDFARWSCSATGGDRDGELGGKSCRRGTGAAIWGDTSAAIWGNMTSSQDKIPGHAREGARPRNQARECELGTGKRARMERFPTERESGMEATMLEGNFVQY